jgi:actin-related protein 6
LFLRVFFCGLSLLDPKRRQPKRNAIIQSYVLPDFTVAQMATDRRLGYILPRDEAPPPPSLPHSGSAVGWGGRGGGGSADEFQVLTMENERFAVPEVLFNPSIIGLDQSGLPETVAASVASLPEDIQGLFWGNIICVGGNATMPGFHERL